MTHDIDWFLRKLNPIPELKWITGKLTSGKDYGCVMWHCGCRENNTSQEGKALIAIFARHVLSPFHVNDGKLQDSRASVQYTPKGRIIAHLKLIKRLDSQ